MGLESEREQGLRSGQESAAEPDSRAARPAKLWSELRSLPERAVFPAAALTAALAAPKGRQRPVLVLPGFMANDRSTFALRGFLRAIGHRPAGWGMGRNVGPADHIIDGLGRRLLEVSEEAGGPIDLIGWSLGGVFARMLAIEHPEMVRQVISLGSPITLERHQSNVTFVYEFMSSIWKFSPSTDTHDVNEIPVPSTTVWSRNDGVVAGLACRQTPGTQAEAIEVRGAHSGLLYNGAVLRIVADRLAQPADSWAPFQPSPSLRSLYPSLEGGT